MGWAAFHIAKLKAGETIQFRPHGRSMEGKVEHGQLCTVEPIKDKAALKVGDVVLCKVYGREFLHLVKAIRPGQWQIANNKGHINGWIGPDSIFGICTKIEE